MDTNNLAQLSVGLIAAILVLREVFSFLKTRNGNNPVLKRLDEIDRRVQQLYDWHNVTDENGTKIWYAQRSMSRSVEKLSESIQAQTVILKQMVEEMRNLYGEVRELAGYTRRDREGH